ncbi:hypothetical protein BHE74_00020360 [Ensete ventricosum]|nr:hypothetical protein GW17_00014573 [Ensete ventricosum]RWW71865.1 hypothetical protein BHE74_00020360 [Ensete ventricosum]
MRRTCSPALSAAAFHRHIRVAASERSVARHRQSPHQTPPSSPPPTPPPSPVTRVRPYSASRGGGDGCNGLRTHRVGWGRGSARSRDDWCNERRRGQR